MIADYYLLIISLVWVLFASIQDIRKREVANWLNFSLLGFALIFRFGQSWFSGNWDYLFFGLVGVGVYFIVANIFYYTKVFAGGDAKLLWALGAILPYYSWQSLWIMLAGFLILFMLTGVIYTGVYSLFLMFKNYRIFSREFEDTARNSKWIFYLCWIVCLIIYITSFLNGIKTGFISILLIFLLPLIYCYLRAVEKACLVSYVGYENLKEGDWLDSAIKIKGKWIGKSVHGLSNHDILLLKKGGKKVWLKEGIPFVPVFLVSIIIMLYAFSSGLLEYLTFDKIVSLFLGF